MVENISTGGRKGPPQLDGVGATPTHPNQSEGEGDEERLVRLDVPAEQRRRLPPSWQVVARVVAWPDRQRVPARGVGPPSDGSVPSNSDLLFTADPALNPPT